MVVVWLLCLCVVCFVVMCLCRCLVFVGVYVFVSMLVSLGLMMWWVWKMLCVFFIEGCVMNVFLLGMRVIRCLCVSWVSIWWMCGWFVLVVLYSCFLISLVLVGSWCFMMVVSRFW